MKKVTLMVLAVAILGVAYAPALAADVHELWLGKGSNTIKRYGLFDETDALNSTFIADLANTHGTRGIMQVKFGFDNGTVWTTNDGGGAITAFSTQAVSLGTIPGSAAANFGFSIPIAVNPNAPAKRVYVQGQDATTSLYKIVKFDKDGNYKGDLTPASGLVVPGLGTAGSVMGYSEGMEIDAQGNIYVSATQATNNAIIRLDPDGSNPTIWAENLRTKPQRLRFDSSGTLWYTGANNEVIRIDSPGSSPSDTRNYSFSVGSPRGLVFVPGNDDRYYVALPGSSWQRLNLNSGALDLTVSAGVNTANAAGGFSPSEVGLVIVPEPTTLALLALGGVMVMSRRRRRA